MDGRQLLKRYDAYMREAHSLRNENRFLRGERDHYRRHWFFTQQRLNKAEESNQQLREENRRLKQQNKELTASLKTADDGRSSPAQTSPKFKPSIKRRGKKPGRKAGHPPALRRGARVSCARSRPNAVRLSRL